MGNKKRAFTRKNEHSIDSRQSKPVASNENNLKQEQNFSNNIIEASKNFIKKSSNDFEKLKESVKNNETANKYYHKSVNWSKQALLNTKSFTVDTANKLNNKYDVNNKANYWFRRAKVMGKRYFRNVVSWGKHIFTNFKNRYNGTFDSGSNEPLQQQNDKLKTLNVQLERENQLLRQKLKTVQKGISVVVNNTKDVK
jgi:hypothetical protein